MFAAIVQLAAELNSLVRFRFANEPLQSNTATCGSFASTVIPKTSATALIVSFPPTGQNKEPKSSVLTQASAKFLHPG